MTRISYRHTNQIIAYTYPKTVRTVKIKHVYLSVSSITQAKTNTKNFYKQRVKNKKLIFLRYCDFQEKNRDIRRNYIIKNLYSD